ncbi:hypothetical protein BaRGS_00019350 [Batillaria attramentaria]|uniref:Uncharacterized protein n=1 Tax=Batillaria attramentaria TaxID=370345 RepID=A0ABD0KQN8_9CAEN
MEVLLVKRDSVVEMDALPTKRGSVSEMEALLVKRDSVSETEAICWRNEALSLKWRLCWRNEALLAKRGSAGETRLLCRVCGYDGYNNLCPTPWTRNIHNVLVFVIVTDYKCSQMQGVGLYVLSEHQYVVSQYLRVVAFMAPVIVAGMKRLFVDQAFDMSGG